MKRNHQTASAGQAVAEFALTASIFLLLIMAIVDFGRAIYVYNGVSQAAREIARTTSVHPGDPLGDSLDTADTVAVQEGLVPGLATPTFECVDDAGAAVSRPQCGVTGDANVYDYVKVTASAPWSPATPLLAFLGSFTLSSSSTMRLS